MKKFLIFFIAVSYSLFCACKDVDVYKEGGSAAVPTIITTSPDDGDTADIESALTSPDEPADSYVSQEPPVTKETDSEAAASPADSIITEPGEPGSTAPENTEETSSLLPDEPNEPTADFSFPEEFYTRLEEIFIECSINRNCTGESPCGCNPEYEVLDENGEVIEPRDRVMSVYYMDIESGYEVFVNEGVHYPVASTIKIPYCVYIYDKLTSGEIDPETVLVYEQRHYFKGTGVIIKGEFGQRFTVSELLKLAITESDNVAFEMLKDLSTWNDFMTYLESKGMSHIEDRRKSKEKICLEAAAADGKVLAEFLRGDSEYIEAFKADLLVTKNKMIKSHYPFYRKYGWTKFAFHDIAYVDAPHPYIIAILSNLEGEDKADYKLFADISYLVEEYSQAERVLPEAEIPADKITNEEP